MSWGVLVYVVADERENQGESLDQVAGTDLGRLLKAAQEADLPIAAQIDYEGIPGLWRQIRGTLGGPPTAVQLLEADSNSPSILRGFLEWGPDCLKTDHYLLMLWGHGAGPGGFFSDGPMNAPAHIGHPMSPKELSQALNSFIDPKDPEKRPFDILLTKACFASSLEVASQLRASTRFVIASQNLIPSQTFWPYREMFKRLEGQAKPNTPDEVKELAVGLVDELGAFYSDERNRPGKVEVPYSLLNLAKAETVTGHVTQLVSELRKKQIDLTELAARSSPGDPALMDIPRFCENLLELGDADITSAANDLRASVALGADFVVARHPRPSAFRGVSIFFHPGYGMNSPVRDCALYGMYKRSELATKTNWIDFAFQNSTVSKLAERRGQQ